MILVFDLDDTLYEEITYVKDSFKAVAEYLSKKYKLSAMELYHEFISVLDNEGRGRVFDIVLSRYKIFTKKEVEKCLMVYRKNEPNIILTKEARDCIQRFKDETKYLVTDGNKIVQDKKVRALNLYSKFKKIFITHRFGLQYSKPSPYCFKKIEEIESISAERIIYIGDNPYKDFIGIKPYGFKTVRVNQGMFKDIYLDKKHEADVQVNSLNEITLIFLESHFNIDN
jgi:putative hydrolase of the HAD superfamily